MIKSLINLKKDYKKYNTCNTSFIKIINKAIIKEVLSLIVLLVINTIIIYILFSGV